MLLAIAALASPAGQSARTPDLQGVWSFSTLTPLERPAEFTGREFLTDAEALAFAKKLQALLPCEVLTWDERLTTTAANRALRESGRKTRDSRGVVDQVAAQMILQSYLDSLPATGIPGGS